MWKTQKLYVTKMPRESGRLSVMAAKQNKRCLHLMVAKNKHTKKVWSADETTAVRISANKQRDAIFIVLTVATVKKFD